ncbi:hypothetical protein DB347_17635 [Opitutaceae bacterium EW11]|nr:hypothetical protein DB347_17635 [Opitutaceae bacterium EW11]
MKKAIKVPYGFKNGELTHISQVPSGQKCGCTCIACGAPLVARKGPKRTHHFGHQSDSQCAETVMHKLGKLFLKQRIDEAIVEGKPVPFRWKCEHCDETHEANLVKKAVRCAEEVSLDSARADLALYDAEGRMFSALEIVVSHNCGRSWAGSAQNRTGAATE